MKIPKDISVFNLNNDQIAELTKTRLYPQNNNRGRYGCASLTGFLAQGEHLMDVAQSHRKTLLDRSISYDTIAKRLHEISSAAVRALGKPSEKPVLVENGKFEVTVHGPTLCEQFCPFSPEDDSQASQFTKFDRECPSSGQDYTIRNTTNNKSIKFGGLLPHLIGIHNFFPGNVKYRLDPIEAIETLELSPEERPLLESAKPKLEDTNLTGTKKFDSWEFVGMYKFPKRDLKELAKRYGSQLEKIEGDLFKIDLPYYHGYHDSPETIKFENPKNYVWSHFFNLNPNKIIEISKSVNGALLTLKVPQHFSVVMFGEKIVDENSAKTSMPMRSDQFLPTEKKED